MIQQIVLEQLRNKIDREIGLYYSDERLETLTKRLKKAAQEIGTEDAEYARRLLSNTWDRQTISMLVKHLTIPETYFFRDRSVFDLLEDIIVPQIALRCAREESLVVVWSSSCATGEEPYSLAILLHTFLPPALLPRVQIIATDINEDYLVKAREGIYSTWSLRTTPTSVTKAYFSEVSPGKFRIAEYIRQMVKFDYANLVSLDARFQNQTVDLLLCRNTLIYFSQAQTRSVLNNLSRALRPNGWCLLAAAEVPFAPPEHFTSVRYPGAVVFKKKELTTTLNMGAPSAQPAGAYFSLSSLPPVSSSLSSPVSSPVTAPLSKAAHPEPSAPPEPPELETAFQLKAPSLPSAQKLYAEGHYHEAVEMIGRLFKDADNKTIEALRLLSECYRRKGDIPQSLQSIDEAILLDRLDASLYYWKAMFLHEQDDFAGAVDPLKQALFLDPKFVLAEFMLSSFLGRVGNPKEAAIHLRNTESLLSELPVDAVLPESDGMSAGQLQELVKVLKAKDKSERQHAR